MRRLLSPKSLVGLVVLVAVVAVAVAAPLAIPASFGVDPRLMAAA